MFALSPFSPYISIIFITLENLFNHTPTFPARSAISPTSKASKETAEESFAVLHVGSNHQPSSTLSLTLRYSVLVFATFHKRTIENIAAVET